MLPATIGNFGQAARANDANDGGVHLEEGRIAGTEDACSEEEHREAGQAARAREARVGGSWRTKLPALDLREDELKQGNTSFQVTMYIYLNKDKQYKGKRSYFVAGLGH